MAQRPPAPSPSDIPADKADYMSNLKGGLPTRKRRNSPFDRIGAKQWNDEKGQPKNSYA